VTRHHEELRRQLVALLDGGNAHIGLSGVLEGFPMESINEKPPGLPYSFWHLLEHMRIVQWDIVRFVVDPNHVSPPTYDLYWPPEDLKVGPAEWRKTVEEILDDLAVMRGLAADPTTDLMNPLPHAPGYTLIREILLVADHNAFHAGELVILRRIMGIPAPEE
jgi:hypothetical protein